MTSIRSSASLPTFLRVTDREVWIKAGAIHDKWGSMTADYIISHLADSLDNQTAVEDWRRVAAAVDAMEAAKPQ
jgi:hypothetical protein